VEEFFEVSHLGAAGLPSQVPAGCSTSPGYYERLLAFVDHGFDEGFVRREQRAMISVSSSPAGLLDVMAAYRAPFVEKWIERSET
jgi:predicted Rossmann-fold nucleotide-binding protein